MVAAVLPGPGLFIRSIDFGSLSIGQARITLSLPPAMLAFLLFNAGLGVKTAELSGLARRPWLLIAGASANVLGPLTLIVAVYAAMGLWHNPDEVQRILTGLALVASMPIAGASTGWSQNANGNLALSLGLILLTTICSPLLTPLVLHAVGFLTTGDYSEDLHELASAGAGSFLGIWVILPSFLGMAANRALGEKRAALVSPYVKLANSGVLALLNYSNASLSLPGVISYPDFDYVAVMLFITTLLCFAMFAFGYFLARASRAGRAAAASLMFGLGMNNNGAGLVLASIELADHPGVMLPVIFYNLVQHLVASLVDRTVLRTMQPQPQSRPEMMESDLQR